MLPLARPETLAILGLGAEEMERACAAATAFVRFVLDKVEDEPATLGLPAAQPAAVFQATPSGQGILV